MPTALVKWRRSYIAQQKRKNLTRDEPSDRFNLQKIILCLSRKDYLVEATHSFLQARTPILRSINKLWSVTDSTARALRYFKVAFKNIYRDMEQRNHLQWPPNWCDLKTTAADNDSQSVCWKSSGQIGSKNINKIAERGMRPNIFLGEVDEGGIYGRSLSNHILTLAVVWQFI